MACFFMAAVPSFRLAFGDSKLMGRGVLQHALGAPRHRSWNLHRQRNQALRMICDPIKSYHEARRASLADQNHVARLKVGVDSWNAWRAEVDDFPDLRGADLRDLVLDRVGLANTRGVDLTHARLDHADFTGARLRGADFTLASLRTAKLVNCDLRETYFHVADLSDALLTRADLRGADFMKANLARVDVTGCQIQYTGFDFVDLSTANGLATCEHFGPSDIGFTTLTRSGPLPTTFLRGCGLSDEIIEYVQSISVKPFAIYLCFISYSHADKPFADALYSGLQEEGIRCWKDDHEIPLGGDIRNKVAEGIRLAKRVVLVCSAHSLSSPWVVDEIEKTLQKEEELQRESGRHIPVLIPLLLDRTLFEWIDGRASYLRRRLAGDFTDWRDPSAFQVQLKRLIASLRSRG